MKKGANEKKDKRSMYFKKNNYKPKLQLYRQITKELKKFAFR